MAWEPWKQALLPFNHRSEPEQLILPAIPVTDEHPRPEKQDNKAPPPPPIEI